MIAIPSLDLSEATVADLQSYQAGVDSEIDYPQRVRRAAQEFSRRNRPGNAAFREVRGALDAMCSGARRCMYCEDSAADEVEHHHPKTLYPGMVFAWSNYLYACGPCNGHKRSNFWVLDMQGEPHNVARTLGSPIAEPPSGDPALLHPRRDDPLRYIDLDISGGTFLFVPIPTLAPVNRAKARITIDLLGLNRRDFLPRARREAYLSYRARLLEYDHKRQEGVSAADLDHLRAAIGRMHHPTVWREMQRQRTKIPELQSLFAKVPEALAW